MSKSGKKWILKEFLSDDYGESGSIVCSTHQSKDEEGWNSASIQIRGCYKEPVELEFGFYSGKIKSKKKRIKKIEKMISCLEKFKEALERLE